MSATAVSPPAGRALHFYDSTIGKKVVMAVTGAILLGFVIGHLIGNLQIFLPDARVRLRDYALFLRNATSLIWTARIVLLASVVLHIVAAVQLSLLKRAARPVGYVRAKAIRSSYASRTMMWSGPIIAAFVIYHLLHFTFGTVHPDFSHDYDVYSNVVLGFQQVPVSLAYIGAMVLLGMHLYHGVWSMFQSVGVSHPRYTPLLKRFAALSAAFIVIGNISIPLAVLTGFVRL